jgi:alpha-L-rhamnosidase
MLNSTLDQSFFENAKPIWPIGAHETWNQVVGFYASLNVAQPLDKRNIEIHVTAADCYRIWLNGRFVAYGPARTAHGYSRVDVWPLGALLEKGTNHIAIEVSSNGIDSYAYALHEPFVQAEVYWGHESILATGGDAFEAYVLKERVQKVERFSKQRPFAEAYRLGRDCNDWRTGVGGRQSVACETVRQYDLLPRHVPLPEFKRLSPVMVRERGKVISAPGYRSILHHAARDQVGVRVMGYPVDALEIDISKELLDFGYVPDMEQNADAEEAFLHAERIPAAGYVTYTFDHVQGGFIEARLMCEKRTRVYLQFDEVCDRGRDKQFQLGVGAIALDLEPGTHAFTSFEPYSLRFIRVLAVHEAVDCLAIGVREYAHPVPEPRVRFQDPALLPVHRAAWQTFRTNSIDLFTDCISRERGGYPCDAYFTAMAERALTGESRVERNFLENYFLVDTFASIPKGMVPHCYPSVRLGTGQYIPNWGLWLVLELCEYCMRTGDQELKNLAKPRVEALFTWFSQYRNRDGLLEDVPGWLFVEWSPANQYTDGVSHPTNMLYAGTLQAAATLYLREDWQKAADQTRDAVLRESWDGSWFADQSRRVDGVLQCTDARSETCQYHALFFEIVSGEDRAALWQRLSREWGPLRNPSSGGDKQAGTGHGVQLIPAGLLYGLMLRFALMQKTGAGEQLIAELCHVFGPMARQTGTLWEHVAPQASFNHGFASCACAFLQTMS